MNVLMVVCELRTSVKIPFKNDDTIKNDDTNNPLGEPNFGELFLFFCFWQFDCFCANLSFAR